jgi:trehalose 6-phosphate synthase/phosphatase
MKAESRIILVSHRGPYRLRQTPEGTKRERTIGGLATALLPLVEKIGGVWITSGDSAGEYQLPLRKPSFELIYLSLTPDQKQKFYFGLSNNALWPLCHSFLGRVHYDMSEWEVYEQVNHQFAEAALKEAHERDIFWLHDYQMARAPAHIRKKRPEARILFFWHIPFPPVEIFRTLPWRQPMLEGLLANNLIGFHTTEYSKNFMEAAVDLLGARVEGNIVHFAGMKTEVITRPIGIDYAALDAVARSSHTEARIQQLRKALTEDTLIIGVERMDYTKGIVERLRGVEYLLDQQPEWRGRFSLIQIVTPSRDGVESYRQKKREIDEMVGRVNGRFSDGVWIPVRYIYHSFSPSELIAYYRASDIALITPLRDGLNMVAKEYVAARIHNDGAVVLSEFAGVAAQLPEAIITNPYSQEDVAGAIAKALQMPKAEQHRRMSAMRENVRTQDIRWWAEAFLSHFDHE